MNNNHRKIILFLVLIGSIILLFYEFNVIRGSRKVMEASVISEGDIVTLTGRILYTKGVSPEPWTAGLYLDLNKPVKYFCGEASSHDSYCVVDKISNFNNFNISEFLDKKVELTAKFFLDRSDDFKGRPALEVRKMKMVEENFLKKLFQ